MKLKRGLDATAVNEVVDSVDVEDTVAVEVVEVIIALVMTNRRKSFS